MAVFKRLFFDMPGFGRLNAMPGGSLKLPGMTRTGVVADTGRIGYSEEPVYGELSFKLPNQAGLSLVDLGNLGNVTVTVQDDNSKTWQCSDAFVTTPPTLSNGEVDVAMQFANVEEVR